MEGWVENGCRMSRGMDWRYEWMTDGKVGGRKNGSMRGLLDEGRAGGIDGGIGRQLDGWVSGGMEGWKDEWTIGQMEGWTEKTGMCGRLDECLCGKIDEEKNGTIGGDE